MPLSPRRSSPPAPAPTLDIDTDIPLEDDLGHPQSWTDELEPETPRAAKSLKGKERAEGPFDDAYAYVDESSGDQDDDAATPGPADAYPPMTDDATESKRIEENLRRWETAERQRRKAARESHGGGADAHVHAHAQPSLFQRLLTTSSARRPTTADRTALGTTEDVDDAVALDDIEVHSPAHSPSPSPAPPSSLAPTSANSAANPFADPPSDVSSRTTATTLDARPTLTHSASSLFVGQTSSSSSSSVKSPNGAPPPIPLDIPPPRSPPPLNPTDRPPAPRSPPSTAPTSRTSSPSGEVGKEPPRVRWWHEILCGCGEGPDRGGDEQSGRTNPLE